MGEVYRARDTSLKRDVALKLLPETFAADSERLARFQREAEVLASLNHPHIAAIYGLEEADGVKALVMELVEGADLAERIARGAIPLERGVADGEADHRGAGGGTRAGDHPPRPQASKHQTATDGTVKVLDFGLAKAMRADAPGAEPRRVAHHNQADRDGDDSRDRRPI